MRGSVATSRSRAASRVVIGYDDRSGGGLESVRHCYIALRPTDLAFGRRASGRRDGEGRVFVGRVIVGQTSIVFFARLAVFRLLSGSLCERMYFTETCVTYCLLLSMFLPILFFPLVLYIFWLQFPFHLLDFFFLLLQLSLPFFHLSFVYAHLLSKTYLLCFWLIHLLMIIMNWILS